MERRNITQVTLKTNTMPSIFNKQEVEDHFNCTVEDLLCLNLLEGPVGAGGIVGVHNENGVCSLNEATETPD